jgi:hypothetical protein
MFDYFGANLVWDNFMYAVLLILLLWVLVAAGAYIIRKRRIERWLVVRITNLGNIEASFRLVLEDPNAVLRITFYHLRKRLPIFKESFASQPALAYAGASNSGEDHFSSSSKVSLPSFSLVNSISNMLTSFGSILPKEIGRPLQQAGSKIYRGQIKVGSAKSKFNRTTAYIPTRSSTNNAPPVVSVTQNQVLWAETPVIKPGDKLDIRIRLCSAAVEHDKSWSFRILSVATGSPLQEVVAQENQVNIKGGFLSHALFPQLLLLGLLAAALIALFWMRSTGYLF